MKSACTKCKSWLSYNERRVQTFTAPTRITCQSRTDFFLTDYRFFLTRFEISLVSMNRTLFIWQYYNMASSRMRNGYKVLFSSSVFSRVHCVYATRVWKLMMLWTDFAMSMRLIYRNHIDIRYHFREVSVFFPSKFWLKINGEKWKTTALTVSNSQ